MIVNSAVYADGRVSGISGDPERSLRIARSRDGFVWLGLADPDAEELQQVATAFGLPPQMVADATDSHERPSLDVDDDVSALVVKTIWYRDETSDIDTGQVAFFVAPHLVLTVRSGVGSPLADVRQRLDVRPDWMHLGPWAVVHAACDAIVDAYTRVADEVARDLENVEDDVFSANRSSDEEAIYNLKRENLEFRRALVPLVPALARIARGAPPGVGEAAELFVDLIDHVNEDIARIESIDALLSTVLQAHLARVTVRQNEDMRKISAWVAILAVPTMVAGIYGMNFEHMPELHWRYGYLVVILVILAACLVLYRAFRRSGWL